jgi:hypothetical protein
MPDNPPPPEIAFLASPMGGSITIGIAVCAFLAVLFWARRPGHPDRWAAVLAATGTSVLMGLITILAVIAGWWQGAFLQIPLPVGLAIYLPFSIAGYTLWLGLYRWIARQTRRAFLIYVGVVLLFIPIVLLVDPIQMSRGQFEMGGGYTVWIDALVGQVVMLSPVVFYEFFRHKVFNVNISAI